MTPDESPFTALGLGVDATIDQITAAWKSKVENLHPDRFPDATYEESEKLHEELSRVNAAYELLVADLTVSRELFRDQSTTQARHNSVPGRSARRHSQNRKRPAYDSSCEICGSLNTAIFSFTRQVGMIFRRQIETLDSRLCKSCALSLGRNYQSRTMTTGWWGVISCAANLSYVFKNALELRKARNLLLPQGNPGISKRPLEPGRGVLLRPFTWIGPLILTLTIGALSQSGSSSSSPTYEWAVGSCVSYRGTKVGPSSCSESHSGRIIDYLSGDPSSCPVSAEAYVERDGYIYCIDENQ